MRPNHRLLIGFAHINELDEEPSEPLNEKLRCKWKSRRLAQMLLPDLAEKLGVEMSLAQIQRTASGRPFVPNSGWDFNISHSGEWVALVCARTEPPTVVGIDIEHPQKPRRFFDLLAHFASDEERCELLDFEACPELAGLETRFYLSWCLREAVLKSQGVGIAKLSSVTHCLREKQIFTPHCPTGRLYFYSQLPFFLAAFFEAEDPLPSLYQWQKKRWKRLENLQPRVYAVNP